MKELFLQRAKTYFGDRFNEYTKKINEPCTQGFFLNTLKSTKEEILSMIDFPYTFSPLTNSSFYHNCEGIGKTKAYELGLIYPQEIAASLTTTLIEKQDIRLVVDLCAAPGGKTINALNRINNNCICISNDYNHTRALQLSQNIERLGIDNVIITNKKPSELAKQISNCADLVILDAPCSGEGMIRKYPEILDTYSIDNILDLAKTQKELLEDAYSLLAKDGLLLYSTCTYAFEEDEDQINYFLSIHQDMSIVNQENDFSSQLHGTSKLSPIFNTEGQFICLMRKNGGQTNKYKKLKVVSNKEVDKYIKDNLNLNNYYLYTHNNNYYLSLVELPDLNSNVLKYGKCLGNFTEKNRFEPNHDIYRSNSFSKYFKYIYNVDDDEYINFIQGYELKIDKPNGYYLVTYKNYSLGFGKCSNGILKNKYPKGLRRVV